MKKAQTLVTQELVRHRVRFVRRALTKHKWNMLQTAKALKMKRSWLYHIVVNDPTLKRAWKQARKRTGQLTRRQRPAWASRGTSSTSRKSMRQK